MSAVTPRSVDRGVDPRQGDLLELLESTDSSREESRNERQTDRRS